MTFSALKFLLIICFSIVVHLASLALIFDHEPRPKHISEHPPSMAEQNAIEAFAKLDEQRLTDQRVSAAAEQIVDAIETLDIPAIEIPKPKNQFSKKTKPKSEPSIKTNPKSTPKANTPSSGSAAYSKAQKNAAYQAFGIGVQRALLSSPKLPRGVRNVRAIVELRFTNGKLSSVKLIKGSGNKKFDVAVMGAAKRARYPKAPAGLKRSVAYRIPVKI